MSMPPETDIPSDIQELAGTLETSPHFDQEWYLERYADAAESHYPASVHYLLEGMAKGYNPGPFFNWKKIATVFTQPVSRNIQQLSALLFQNATSAYKMADYDTALEFLLSIVPHADASTPSAASSKPAGLNAAGPDTATTPLSPYREKKYGRDIHDIFQLNWQGEDNRPKLETGFHILFISHELTQTGAPSYLLDIIRDIGKKQNITTWLASAAGGELLETAKQHTSVLTLDAEPTDVPLTAVHYARLLRAFASVGQKRVVIFNTCCTPPWVYEYCKALDIKVVSLLHEMPSFIRSFWDASDFSRLFSALDGLIVPSNACKNKNSAEYGLAPEKIHILHGRTDIQPPLAAQQCKQAITNALDMPEDTLLVLGCGSLIPLKGPETFATVASLTPKEINGHPVAFIWVGRVIFENLMKKCESIVAASSGGAPLFFAGFQEQTAVFFNGADIFLLPSRIDTFPLVNLEAMALELPVIMFDEAGGASEAHTPETGVVVAQDDAEAMARETRRLLADDALRRNMGEAAKARVNSKFRTQGMGTDLLAILFAL